MLFYIGSNDHPNDDLLVRKNLVVAVLLLSLIEGVVVLGLIMNPLPIGGRPLLCLYRPFHNRLY
jgi:hypothetical protein